MDYDCTGMKRTLIISFFTVIALIARVHARELRPLMPGLVVSGRLMPGLVVPKPLVKGSVVPGAALTKAYFPLLVKKRMALVVNQASRIGTTHLADSLVRAGFLVSKILAPEHGFRGTADAGQALGNTIDAATGISVISLYGKHIKPDAADLKDIDLVVFDLQDVGARFYTYLSTLHEVMLACAEQHIPLLVLDRPNPNGSYIDGPVLDTLHCRSFVGMHPVPVVYGMTIGEYAAMINGEGWLGGGNHCSLNVQPIGGYTHASSYPLPLPPSPNLPNDLSIQLYPGLCFFEGTVISLGRGTDFPFQVAGHPALRQFSFSFTPRSIPGKSSHPPYEDQTCYGLDLRSYDPNAPENRGRLNLGPLLKLYASFPQKDKFFNAYFEKIAGTLLLRSQVIAGLNEQQIRESWKPGLDAFRKIRRKYLLYPD